MKSPGAFLFLDVDTDELTVSGREFFGTRAHNELLAWLEDVGVSPETAVSDSPLIRRDRSVTYTHLEVGKNHGYRHEVTIELDRDVPPFPESVVEASFVVRHPSRMETTE